jgi:hypothetical protein
MTETVTIGRPSPSLSLDRDPPSPLPSALTLHLDCSRTYMGKLEAEGVIQRQGDGFPLDQCRVAYAVLAQVHVSSASSSLGASRSWP